MLQRSARLLDRITVRIDQDGKHTQAVRLHRLYLGRPPDIHFQRQNLLDFPQRIYGICNGPHRLPQPLGRIRRSRAAVRVRCLPKGIGRQWRPEMAGSI